MGALLVVALDQLHVDIRTLVNHLPNEGEVRINVSILDPQDHATVFAHELIVRCGKHLTRLVFADGAPLTMEGQ